MNGDIRSGDKGRTRRTTVHGDSCSGDKGRTRRRTKTVPDMNGHCRSGDKGWTRKTWAAPDVDGDSRSRDPYDKGKW